MIGCGWLGLPLAAALAADGRQVRGTTTTRAKLERIRAAGITPHLVRLAPGPEGDLQGLFDTDFLVVTVPPKEGDAWLDRLDALLDAARAEGVRRFLFTSSTSAYAARGEVVDESDATRPASERGRRMRAAEERFVGGAGDALVLRLGGLYGEDREPARALAGRTGVAGADAPVNLVHRDDVVAVVQGLLERDIRSGTFNVVADEHPTKREFYAARAAALGLDPPQFSGDFAASKTVSNRKIKDVLAYTFRRLPTV